MKHSIKLAATALLFLSTSAQAAIQATMYKNPDCDCCEKHADYLRKNGFDVKMVVHNDLDGFRRAKGIPSLLNGCHTIVIGDYLVEGHVPAAPIKRMLAEKPKIKGISVPGMPNGSPGMEHDEHDDHGGSGQKAERKPVILDVYTIAPGEPKIYSTERYVG